MSTPKTLETRINDLKDEQEFFSLLLAIAAAILALIAIFLSMASSGPAPLSGTLAALFLVLCPITWFIYQVKIWRTK